MADRMKCQRKTILYMPESLRQRLGEKHEGDIFEAAMDLPGKAFRDVPGRKTSQVELLGKSYFIKQHFGVGWGEILKNLVSFKKPILGAMTEVKAIQKVTSIGIATTPLVAYGQRGVNPAKLQSFILTEDLGDITSLEDLCADWKENPPDASFKRRVIVAAATVAKKIHEAGVNHRDFYLCHLCLDNSDTSNINLYLIDLHRVLIHSSPSNKANMKDVAALYFSSMDVGLTARDYLRFKRHYQKQDTLFWQQVETRAQALYAKFNSQQFQEKLALERAKLK
ncbi:MAG: lipopolysaccharide core heptose(I) kinase RfaP [Methylophilaceae bacterium]